MLTDSHRKMKKIEHTEHLRVYQTPSSPTVVGFYYYVFSCLNSLRSASLVPQLGSEGVQ